MTEALLLRLEMQALLDSYVSVIDEDRLELWPDFFIEDCLYEIIPKENEDLGLPAPVMRCDNRRMLRDRVVSLRNANIFAPATYRHFLSGLQVETAGEGIVDLRCNYLVINSNHAGQSLVYQAGRYLDRVLQTPEGWRFASKRAVFDTSRVQTLLAIPI